MATPLFSIGGLASGLDTTGIIQQLMQLERQPIVRFQQRQTQLRRIDDAWGQVVTKLSAVRAAVEAVRQPADFAAMTKVTASDAAVSASVTGSPATGSTSFTVAALAAAHQVGAGGSFSSPDALVGAGTFTLTRADGTVLGTVTTDSSTTLAGLADRIGALGAGVGAQVVKAADGDHRLVLTSSTTGASAAFSSTTDLAPLATATVLQQGRDAHLKIGSLDVYRPSNTITDLVDGVTLRLNQTTSTAVTVAVERDVDAAVKAVRGLVDALNGALTTLKTLSAYDPDTKKSGPLQGDPLVRRITSELRAAVSGVVDGLAGTHTSAGTVGIALDRYGAVTLDATKLRQALDTDFTAVTRLFSRSGSTTDPRVAFLDAADHTVAGTYAVEVTQAAQVAGITGAAYAPPVGSPKVFTVTDADGTSVSVTIEEGASVTTAVQRINDALRAAGVTTLTASVGQTATGLDAIALAESRYGSASAFTVTGSGDLGLDGTHAGTDVAGTVGGVAATGTGRSLTATSGDASGLRLQVTASQGEVDLAGGRLALGDVTVSTGIAGALDRVLAAAEGSGGAIARARDSLSSEISRYDGRIADFEVRLAHRETTLRRRFAALEEALARLQSQSAWLAAQLATPPAQDR